MSSNHRTTSCPFVLGKYKHLCKTATLGIVLCDSYVTILEFSLKGDSPYIHTYGQALWPSNTFINGQLKQKDAAKNTIKKLLKTISPHTTQAIVSFPDNLTLQKKVHLGAHLSASEHSAWLQREAIKYMPNRAPKQNKMYIDYFVISSNDETIEFNLTAALSSDVLCRVNLLQKIGLKILAVEPSSYALARALNLPIKSDAWSGKLAPLELCQDPGQFIVALGLALWNLTPKINLLPKRKQPVVKIMAVISCLVSAILLWHNLPVPHPSSKLPQPTIVKHNTNQDDPHALYAVGVIIAGVKRWVILQHYNGILSHAKYHDFVGEYQITEINTSYVSFAHTKEDAFILKIRSKSI